MRRKDFLQMGQVGQVNLKKIATGAANKCLGICCRIHEAVKYKALGVCIVVVAVLLLACAGAIAGGGGGGGG